MLRPTLSDATEQVSFARRVVVALGRGKARPIARAELEALDTARVQRAQRYVSASTIAGLQRAYSRSPPYSSAAQKKGTPLTAE